jgi:hydrogenase expression/formation protein HypC
MCLAVPGQVVAITEEDGVVMARVSFGGVEKRVCLEYLPDVAVGEYVVVHVGFAIQRLDEASAKETLASFAGLGLLAEELDGDLAALGASEMADGGRDEGVPL